MSSELKIIPHPEKNTSNYLEWARTLMEQESPHLCPPQSVKRGEFIEAFQSEIAFTHAKSPTPVIASYGAGPCVIVGATTHQVGFVAHFSHSDEVRVGEHLIVNFLDQHLPQHVTKQTVELHLRGGILGDAVSERTRNAIIELVQKVNSLARTRISFCVASEDRLQSRSEESRNLALDTRDGSTKPYDPLRDNPDFYRRLTIEDIQFAQRSFEVAPALRPIYAC